MLIRIDDSVIDSLNEKNAAQNEIITAIELLALARKEGKHSVIASPSGIDKILNSDVISSSSKKVFNKLRAEAKSFLSYLSFVSTYIEVVYPCLIPSKRQDNNKNVIKIPPKFSTDTETIQRTIFLSENLEDIEFYGFIAKAFCCWNKMPFILSYEPRNGGGSTTGETYYSVQKNEKRFCLCIVDSDKIYPTSPLGETAKRVEKADDPNCPYSSYWTLRVSEIENLIPSSFFSDFCVNDAEKQKALKLLEEILGGNHPGAINFLDIKKGLQFKKILDSKDEKAQLFWFQVLSGVSANLASVDTWCIQNNACQGDSSSSKDIKNKTQKKCQCKLNLGFGDKVLSHLIEWLKDKDPAHSAHLVNEITRKEWEEVGQLMLSWFFTRPPIIT
jgi:hypothetical protein